MRLYIVSDNRKENPSSSLGTQGTVGGGSRLPAPTPGLTVVEQELFRQARKYEQRVMEMVRVAFDARLDNLDNTAIQELYARLQEIAFDLPKGGQ